ncbi:hypothetical protein DAEQUDRAFT_536793 [Daedalea quercina L-15889]|uniref:Uncharacterized protein n=1 Tax=Daedalea quercina L-15889 TaxID=1314783 RepID=A0A165M5A0_9APHY|nr:hypothetical protein DAEQUDRAFT_536793 [Daedalea quercina L-15889]
MGGAVRDAKVLTITALSAYSVLMSSCEVVGALQLRVSFPIEARDMSDALTAKPGATSKKRTRNTHHIARVK